MLQLIAGRLKRRRLHSPKDESTTRPIPSRVRESIFNMLTGHVEGEVLFDAFAGVGTFGLEAVSRGARHVVMVERDRAIAKLLRANAEELGVTIGGPPVEREPDTLGTVSIMHGDALGPAALAACPRPVHVAFFDPPYPLMWESSTRRRVLEQFVNVAQRLDDTGFALLRTPWPLREQPDDEHAKGPDVSDELERLPGVDGPETHEYGSMAVHWYMKSR